MSEEQKNFGQSEDHVTPDAPAPRNEAVNAQMPEAAPTEAVPEAAAPTPEETPEAAPEVTAAATPDAPTAEAASTPEATTEAPAPEAAPAEAPKPKKEKKEKKEKKAKEKPQKPEKAQKAPEENAAESEPSPKAEAAPKAPREKSRKQKKEKRRVEDPPRYKKHEVLRAFTGVIKFILILLLGMIIAYGSIAGALFFAVGGLTIDMLQEWGIVGDVDQYLTDTGDVDLTATTLLQLILDLNEVSENIGSYNMRTLIAHYGVVLPEETLAALPTDLFEIPLDQLMSENAATVITENLKLGYLLSFFPDGFLAEPVKNTLKDRPLSLLTNGKYGELLADVHLGYFLGVTFDEAGNVVYKDPDSHTPQEAMAKLDVGALLEALMNNGDLLGVMANDLGDQPVRPFISGLMSGALLEKMCEGRLLRDVLLPDAETGKYTFSFAALSEGVYLGDTLGYTLVDTDGDGVGDVWYSSYTDDGDDQNDVKASTMYATLADISLADIINNQVSLDASFDGLFFGDLQSGYVRGDAIMGTDEATGEPVVVGYEWFREGARVGKMQEKLANVMVNTVLNGQLDVGAVIGDLKIGDLQGYTYRAITEEGGDAIIGYEWVKQGEGGALVKVSPVMGAIADVSLSTVLDGQLDLAATLSGLSLGDVQNYEKGTDNKWYHTVTPEGGEPYTEYVGAVKNALADVSLSSVMNGELDISATLSGLYLGDVQGFERHEDNKWYKTVTPEGGEPYTEYVGAVKNALADVSLSSVMNGELDISATLSGLSLGDVQGFERHEDNKWYQTVTPEGGEPYTEYVGAVENAIADVKLTEVMEGTFSISAALDGLRLGDAMDYTRGEVTTPADPADPDSYDFYGFTKPAQDPAAEPQKVTGAALEIANIPLTHMIDGKVELEETIRKLTIAEAMDYVKVDTDSDGVADTWYSTYTDDNNDENDVKVTGILAVLADKKISELTSDTIDGIYLGDVLGYTFVDTDNDGTGDEWWQNGAKATGIMSVFAELKIGDLSNADLVGTHVRRLTLAEAMGYEKHGDVWYSTYIAENDSGNVKLTGILAVLAEKKLSDLNSATIDGLYLGDVLGYTFVDTNGDGEGDEWWQNGAKATGIMSVFADLKIGDLSNSDLVGTHVRRLTLAEAMGYVKIDTDGDGVADTWYSKYSDDGDATNDVKLTGILAVLAEKKLSDINSETIDGLYLGEVLGYVKVDTDNNGELDAWYQNGAPVKGMMATMADLTIGQLADSHEVSAKLDELHLYEVLDYELVGGKWVSHDGTKTASGVMAHLMDIQIVNIEEEIDEMPLGYAFGFFYDEVKKEWFTDAVHTEKPTGVAAALADIHLTHAREKFDEMNIGTLLGYKHVDTDADNVADTWYSKYSDDGDSTNDVKLDGLNLVFAELLVSDLGNSDKVSGAMQKAKLGDALGFKKYENVWYKTKLDGNNNIVIDTASPVKGVIGALCDNEIGSIETSIQAVSIGTMLNFTEKADGWYDAADQKLNGVLGIIAASNLDNVADNVNSMTVEDLWPERTGVLAAIGDDVKLLELNVAVQNLTVEQLRVAGVLNIDDTKAAKLEGIVGKPLDEVLLPEFINALVALVP